MDIDIMLYGAAYTSDCSVRFQALSPFIGEEEIPVILSGIRKEIIADPYNEIDHDVWVVRAYNEMGEEGYVVWCRTSAICFTGKDKRYPYLWFHSINVFPEELWPTLLTNRDSEEEKIDSYEEEY